MCIRDSDNALLLFKRPYFHFPEIVQYEVQCKGSRNEEAASCRINGSDDGEISVKNLTPNQKYRCKVSSV